MGRQVTLVFYAGIVDNSLDACVQHIACSIYHIYTKVEFRIVNILKVS